MAPGGVGAQVQALPEAAAVLVVGVGVTSSCGAVADSRAMAWRQQRAVDRCVEGGADELVICRGCYEAAAHVGRLSAGHTILFDLEHLP